MKYLLSYLNDFKPIFWGVISDSRINIPAIKDKNGVIIKNYVDYIESWVIQGVLPYKIETNGGNLVGFVGILVYPGPVQILFLQYRPAFIKFQLDINQTISNFIESGSYQFDFLN